MAGQVGGLVPDGSRPVAVQERGSRDVAVEQVDGRGLRHLAQDVSEICQRVAEPRLAPAEHVERPGRAERGGEAAVDQCRPPTRALPAKGVAQEWV
ncbi:hypothetical protein [Acrocarpospora sp. B8E8]|uniref:hypothetical protein n=1 Tax=Acrocarpospora sp. B8E8 TaxID=3153572 RepID=UPI00325F96F0